jgi:imidazolonepropionase-like amidohydrolase
VTGVRTSATPGTYNVRVRTLALLVFAAAAWGQSRFTPGLKPFLATEAPTIVLRHVRVIDGTGAAPREDQTLVIANGKISSASPPADAHVFDLARHTVIPGIVGMHEHLFYPTGGGTPVYGEQAFSFPRLYLASGVTTARTAGSLEPYTDLNVKRVIDAGRMPGPKFWITGPYLEGRGAFTPQMHEITGPDDAVRTVEYWASVGVTSFKAYMNITRADLRAAIDTAHRRGIKVTGHLCSIGFREAAALGIDNLEHGLLVDTEFHPGKQPDVCPPQGATRAGIAKLDIDTAPVREMIADLVKHNVAITSTLAVFEAFDGLRVPLDAHFLDALIPQAADAYRRARPAPNVFLPLLKKELEFERAFAKAGGLLISGADPTGNGGALAGFADLRNIELLVQGGFTPVEAIRIATANGAKFLGEQDRIGTIAPGRQADLVVIDGNPAERIGDIRKVKLVFKDGVSYDPTKLLESVKGAVPLH